MPEQFSTPYRVFVSYAHSDQGIVSDLVNCLGGIGFQVLWDKHINPSKRFTDEIRELIARSHLFIPVVTERAKESRWVNQEIGMALAMNIPILPISLEGSPDAMIAETQAIS